MRGNICIGCISDTDPQPIMVRSKLGLYAVCSIGIIQNAKALSEELLENGCANFETMSIFVKYENKEFTGGISKFLSDKEKVSPLTLNKGFRIPYTI